MPQQLINRATGQPELIEDADLPSAIASQKYEQPQAVAVHSLGDNTYAAPEQLAPQSAYTKPIDPAQVALEQGHAAREKANTGIVAGAKAIAGGAVSGLSMGAFNPFEDAQEFNRGASIAGQIGGALLPGLVGDEAGIAAAITRDPVAVEQVGGSLSSKFLFGGELGAEEGSAARSVERGLGRAGEQLDAAKTVAHLPEDLGGLDAAGLRKARDAELDTLAGAHDTQRATAKSAAVDDVLTYQSQLKEANPYLVTGESSASAPFAKSTRTLRNALDDVEGLRESPGTLLKPLRQQAQALEQTIAERGAIAQKLEATNAKIATDVGEDLATLPDAATHIELTGKAAKRYAAYADVKLTKGAALQVARDDAQGFVEAIQSGKVRGASQEALGKLDGLLESNRALTAKIKGAAAPALARSELTSSRLTSIDAARDALSTPAAKKSLGEEMLGGSVMGHVAGMFSGLPVVGPMIGAKVGEVAKDLVFGRMNKTIAAATERTKGAASAFLDVAKRSTPTLPVASSRILSRVAFGPSGPKQSEKTTAPTLASSFKARAAEIKAQTAYGPDGTPQMRPEAREAMAARLAPIRAVNPVLADRLETLAAARLEFLSSKIPRRPDIGGIPMGPDHWQPSDMEMRTFARYVHAVEDPHGVEERLAHGTVTPEDAEAYNAIYPERAAALKQDVLSSLPTLSRSLPYERRLALSIFTGVPVDPAMHPQVLAVLQAAFTTEPGTNGGSMAPRAQPQFGSVKKSAPDPTPAQRRAEGASS